MSQLSAAMAVARATASETQPRQQTQQQTQQQTPPAPATSSIALIGRHSKNKALSIFLSRTILMSTNGRPWPTIDGIVQLAAAHLPSDVSLGEWEPYVQVECNFVYRTAVGAVNNKLLYSVVQRLTDRIHEHEPATGASEPDHAHGRSKYRFSFDFGGIALPPTLTFDPTDLYDDEPLGVRWEACGFLGRRYASNESQILSSENLRKTCMAAMPFQVAYRYTPRGVAELGLMQDAGQSHAVQHSRSLLPHIFSTFGASAMAPSASSSSSSSSMPTLRHAHSSSPMTSRSALASAANTPPSGSGLMSPIQIALSSGGLASVPSTPPLLPAPSSSSSSNSSFISINANLVSPVCQQPDGTLDLHLVVDHLRPSESVTSIKVAVKQSITLQLVNMQHITIKSDTVVFNEPAAPRYDPRSNPTHHIDCRLSMTSGMSESSAASNSSSNNSSSNSASNPVHALKRGKPKVPARLFPSGWVASDGWDVVQFAPSTACSRLVPGILGMEIKYAIKVSVTLLEESTFGVMRSRGLALTLPFIMSTFAESDAASGITSPMMVPARSGPHVPLFGSLEESGSVLAMPVEPIIFTADTFLPILSELMDDLGHSIMTASTLATEWKTLREQAAVADRMVTRSSDHATILMDLLAVLSTQMDIFAKLLTHDARHPKTSRQVRIPWPRNPVPFNMFLLELELLTQAAPDIAPPQLESVSVHAASSLMDRLRMQELGQAAEPIAHVQVLVDRALEFVEASHAMVVHWVESRKQQQQQQQQQQQVPAATRQGSTRQPRRHGTNTSHETSGVGSGDDDLVPYYSNAQGASRTFAQPDSPAMAPTAAADTNAPPRPATPSSLLGTADATPQTLRSNASSAVPYVDPATHTPSVIKRFRDAYRSLQEELELVASGADVETMARHRAQPHAHTGTPGFQDQPQQAGQEIQTSSDTKGPAEWEQLPPSMFPDHEADEQDSFDLPRTPPT